MAVNWNLAGHLPTFAEQLAGFNSGVADRQRMDQMTARRTAGQQYVGGNRQGAAQTLANAGEYSAATGIADDLSQEKTASEAAERKRESELWLKFGPAIDQAARQAQASGGDPGQAAVAAFDQLIPVFQATPEEVEQFRPALQQDYQTVLTAVMGEAKKQIMQNAGGIYSVDPRAGTVEQLQGPPPAKVDPLEDQRRQLLEAQTEAARSLVPLRGAQAARANRPAVARPRAASSGASAGYSPDQIQWD